MTQCDQTVPSVRPTRTRAGGRRLDASRDAAIASAVVEVLGRTGYAGLTMDAVALAAGVGKATIYRRWSSKAELLLSVMDVVGAPVLEVPDTGALREDLIAVLTEVVGLFGGPSGRAIRSLLGAVVDDPVLQEGCRRLPLANWDQAWETLVTRAEERGEVPRARAGRWPRRSARRCSRCAGWSPGAPSTAPSSPSWSTGSCCRCCALRSAGGP